jgi:hypothetical protein
MADGSYVINPNSGRPVKVGGRAWLKLVKEGVIENANSSGTPYEDPAELYEYEEDATPDQVEETRKMINQKLPKGTHAVRGRGRHKNKLVVRKKPLSAQDVAQYATKTAAQVVSSNLDELENLSNDEIDAKLQELMMSQLMVGGGRMMAAVERHDNLRAKKQKVLGERLKNSDEFQWEEESEEDEPQFSEDEEDEEW